MDCARGRLERDGAKKLLGTKGMTWDFDGIQKVLDEVWEVIDTNYVCWSTTTDKKEFQMMFYAQGQGTGKSRTLTEINKMESLITNVINLGFEHTMHINITFDNGTSSEGEFHDNKLDYLKYRILFHLIGDSVTKAKSNSKGFPEFCNKCTTGLTLHEVIELAAGRFTNDMKKVAVFLMIDSIQKLGDGSSTNDPLRELIRGLSGLCLSSSVFIIPVISATQHIPLADAVQESRTNYRFMETPSLSGIPKRDGNYIFTDTPANCALYNLTHRHPRTVESLEKVLNDGETTNLKDTAEKVLSHVENNYNAIKQLSLDAQNKLIYLAITKVLVSHSTIVVDQNLDFFLKMGLMDLQNNILRLSPIWLCIVANPMLEGSLLKGWDWHAAIYGESWELFTSWYRCLLSKVHPQGSIKLKDLHHGMQFAGRSGDIEINNQPLILGESKEQLGTKYSQNRRANKLIKNGKGAACGDFFCTLSQVDPQREINEVTQCHTQEFVEPDEKPVFAGEKLSKLETDRSRSCDDNDVFVLMTNKRTTNLNTGRQSWKNDMDGKLFGVVSYENMDDYFGPFAPFWRPIVKKEYPLAESLERVESSPTATSSSVSGTLACRYCNATTNVRGEEFSSDWSLRCHENRCPDKQDEDEEE